MTSIMVAYTIGVTQSNIFLGFGYAVFDAIMVVWLRKPISHAVRRVLAFRSRPPIPSDMHIVSVDDAQSR
jgi:hypothetical protein